MKHLKLGVAVLIAAAINVSCQKEIQKTDDQLSKSTTNANVVADRAGDVYTITNSLTDNRVFHYNRASDGTLTFMKSYSTNGRGSGASLGSQGSVILSHDKQWLFVANAGSSEISSFKITDSGLELVDKVSSKGFMPISLTMYGSWLYVLNNEAGFTGSIAGYHVSADGKLTNIANSKRSLSSGNAVRPAQVSFNHNGTSLIITEKAINKIVTFTVDAQGLPGNMKISKSAGIEPFGFAVGQYGNIYVSEAFNGFNKKSTVSSYNVNDMGDVAVLDGLVRDFQTAACWVVLTHDYRYAYVTNTGSNTVSGYHIGSDGDLTLLNADGVTAMAGLAPQDEAVSYDSKYLYVLNQAAKTIGAYSIDAATGALTMIGEIGGLHQKSQGLAAK